MPIHNTPVVICGGETTQLTQFGADGYGLGDGWTASEPDYFLYNPPAPLPAPSELYLAMFASPGWTNGELRLNVFGPNPHNVAVEVSINFGPRVNIGTIINGGENIFPLPDTAAGDNVDLYIVVPPGDVALGISMWPEIWTTTPVVQALNVQLDQCTKDFIVEQIDRLAPSVAICPGGEPPPFLNTTFDTDVSSWGEYVPYGSAPLVWTNVDGGDGAVDLSFVSGAVYPFQRVDNAAIPVGSQLRVVFSGFDPATNPNGDINAFAYVGQTAFASGTPGWNPLPGDQAISIYALGATFPYTFISAPITSVNSAPHAYILIGANIDGLRVSEISIVSSPEQRSALTQLDRCTQEFLATQTTSVVDSVTLVNTDTTSIDQRISDVTTTCQVPESLIYSPDGGAGMGPGWSGVTGPTEFNATYTSDPSASQVSIYGNPPAGYTGAYLKLVVTSAGPFPLDVTVLEGLNFGPLNTIGTITAAGTFYFLLTDATSSDTIEYSAITPPNHPSLVLTGSVVYPASSPVNSLRVQLDDCSAELLNKANESLDSMESSLAALQSAITTPRNINMQRLVAAGTSYVIPAFTTHSATIMAVSAPMNVTMATLGGGPATTVSYPIGSVLNIEADGVLINAITVANTGASGQVSILATA